MKLLDKLLLASLILLLPVGLFLTQWLLGDSDTQLSQEVTQHQLDIEGLEQLIARTVRNNQPKPTPKPRFVINQIEYASESASVEIAGKAPNNRASVMISATFIPSDNQNSTSSDNTDVESEVVRGQSVEVFSIKPKVDGSFRYQYLLPNSVVSGVIELRLDQADATETIIYDLSNQERKDT